MRQAEAANDEPREPEQRIAAEPEQGQRRGRAAAAGEEQEIQFRQSQAGLGDARLDGDFSLFGIAPLQFLETVGDLLAP
jgi:hypothetical protein